MNSPSASIARTDAGDDRFDTGRAFVAKLQRPDHVNETWLEPAQKTYSKAEHDRWDRLFRRQMELLPDRAAPEFLEGLDMLSLGAGGVPNFEELSKRLAYLTGWTVVPVPCVIPDHIFFDHLAHRRFPAGNFIRSDAELDYITEPDVFHDVFGHVPMLAHPHLADFLQRLGALGAKALTHNRLKALGALYWYTIEFGLLETPNGLRLYGAGIASSPLETVFSLEAKSPNRLGFDVERIMRTDYQTSDLQETYFVVQSLPSLLKALDTCSFNDLFAAMSPGSMFAPTAVLQSDRMLHVGTQEYSLRGGRASRALAI
jgi:phenylalanine-4-hydroxylase